MTEPLRASPLTGGLAERDALLATKLHLPPLRPGMVPRPRLLNRLDEGMHQDVVLVCTPAGSGKTTLLADWVRHDRRPVAWLSLDAGDNDPTRFWRHAAAALDGVLPDDAGRMGALLQCLQSGSSSFEAVVTTLVNQMVDGPEVVLVLDDYHVIQTPAVHQSVGFLLEHLPASLRLVVASRADPPLPLARLRARGQLVELRERDLRFTPEEAAELLRGAVGPDVVLPDPVVAALAARTEGWAVGLQLAALSLRGRGRADEFVAAFTGSHRFVLDYLTEEVLERQPEQVRAFLLETSVLERLCAPLCEAVTGQADSQSLLEEIERANLFLLPLDEVRGWWRYHQLFADLLRGRLAQEGPERVRQLHRDAAAWHEAHGLADGAVRHALAAGDTAWATGLVEQYVDELLVRSEGATLHRWLEGLPADMIRSRPRLCLAQTIAALWGGRLEAAESWLADAERALAIAGEEPFHASTGPGARTLANIPATIAVLRAELARLYGDAERAAISARQAEALVGEDERPRGSIGDWHLALVDWLRGRLEAAEHTLAEVVVERRAAGELYMVMRACYDLGQVRQARGRLGAALRTYRQGLEITAAPGGPVLAAAGIAHVGLAEVLRERNELDAALDHATQGVVLCRQLAYTQSLATGLAISAWIRQARGESACAMETMREAEQVEVSGAVVGLFNPVPAVRARLALANGHVGDAASWVRERGLDAEDSPSYGREREYLVLARVLLATGSPGRALPMLERLRVLAVAQGRTGSVIEIQALHALARAAGGDRIGGLTILAEALTLAGAEGHLRTFLDEGTPMAALLGKLTSAREASVVAAGDIAPGFLARLVEAFEEAGQVVPGRPRRGAVLPGMAGSLTSRELELLALLAAGKTNQTIAEELVITLDTVKRHVTHILGKLGAANRTQAVTRARELGLLP